MKHCLKAALVAAVSLATALGCETTTSRKVPIFRQVEKQGTEQDTTPGPGLFVSLGQVHLQAGRTENAVKAFRRAIALDPEHGKAHSLLAVSLDQVGRHREALKSHQEAVRLLQGNAPAWNNMGYCQFRLKKWFDAYESFHKATELEPENPRYQNNAAMSLAMGGLPKESLQRFTRAVGEAQAHYNLGCMYYYQDQTTRARTQFVKALELDPTMEEARQWLKRLPAEPAPEPVPATMPTAMKGFGF